MIRLRGMKTFAGIALITLVLSACAEDQPVGAGDPFGSTTWVLISATVDGAPLALVPGSPVTLTVADGSVGGRAACNSYGGDLTIADGVVTIGSLIQTEMACLDPGVMDLEQAFLAALPRVTGAATDATTLLLSGDGVEMRFEAQPEPEPTALIGTPWALDTIIDGDAASTPAAPANLLIADDGTVSGSTGCNSLSSTYDPDTGFGPIATTKMACKGDVMAQETLILQILDDTPTLSIEADRLTIADLSGRAIVFRAEATDS
jgi:heat shock protein HslJ